MHQMVQYAVILQCMKLFKAKMLQRLVLGVTALCSKLEGYTQGPMLCNILQPCFTNVHERLECFPPTDLSSQVLCLRVRIVPTRVKHFSEVLNFKLAEDKHASLLQTL